MARRSSHSGLVLLTSLLALALVVPTAAAREPAVGDPAPEFALIGSDGRVCRLADHRGQRGVVIAWFPAARAGQDLARKLDELGFARRP